jgi:hypothetical protein
MIRHAKGLVSALLPIVPFVLCHACGGSGGGSSAGTSAGTNDSAPTVAQGTVPSSSNQAPTITGTQEGFAQVGVTYQYQPTASDAEGDLLRFTAANLPPWASIDPDTGRISGTPGENDVGVYEAITIAVADGARTTTSEPFSITVSAQAAQGYAALRWEVPAAKVDGSPLDDLAGYRILYGRSADDLDQSVLIDDPNTTSYEFTTLQSGTWYFAVVAVNAGGLEGPPTVTAMKSI